MSDFSPRIIIAALKGGSGKTMMSVGLAAAWRKKGLTVAPFKKGPDFIDSGWLTFAAERSCHNLDPFLMTKTQIIQSFFLNSAGADISLIEGNRGLFDGFDLEALNWENCLKAPSLSFWMLPWLLEPWQHSSWDAKGLIRI
jgi:cobyrinic acid a,c-diamide synthase